MPDNCPKSAISLEDMLRRTSWAQGLSPEDFARAREGTSERFVPSGGYLCSKGEPVEHWYGVIEGLAKMSSDWVTGKTASFTGIAAGGWFGEGSMLKDEARRYDVVALRDSRVACMRRETFLWLLDVLHPGMESRVAISQEEVGYLAGVSRQRVNRALKVLEDAGFLTTEYGGITVLDLDGLRSFGG
ncbi:MAG: Crp/Fnr family transcriptional regulator [Rhodocyclales bacterium]|nr:Crp/Fnr family transcriptional regulator [Rhodocyclales bacterium]